MWKPMKIQMAHNNELKLVMSSSPVVKSSYCDIFVTLQRIRCYFMPQHPPAIFAYRIHFATKFLYIYIY